MQLDKRYTYSGWIESMPSEKYLISRFERVLSEGGVSRNEWSDEPNGEDGRDGYLPQPFHSTASKLMLTVSEMKATPKGES